MPVKSTTPDAAQLVIPPIDVKVFTFRIVGDSPIITHAWSEKAKKEMRDKQTGAARAKKAPKVIEQEYASAFYRLPNGAPALRTISFKAAAIEAARQVEGLTMVFLRGAFHVIGELTEIVSDEPQMREDMVRVGMGTADLRYRPEFFNWHVDVQVRFNQRVITLEQLIHLFNQAGFSSGVGEWRPNKDGMHGMYHVESVQEVA